MRAVLMRLRSLLFRSRLEREMQEEMDAHLAHTADRLEERGLDRGRAERAARREFGNVGAIQEEARDARGVRWLEALVADARFGLRHFARNPGTSVTMIAVLGLGMGIDLALFSTWHSYVTLPPRGIANVDELVRIRGFQTSTATGERISRRFSPEELDELGRLTDTFRAIGAWASLPITLDVGESNELRSLAATAALVTDDYFEVMGVRPFLGTGFQSPDATDLANDRVAVLSHASWNRLFGGDPAALGATLTLNGIPFTLAGVMPPEFLGVDSSGGNLVWVSADHRRALSRTDELDPEPFRAAGFLRPGVSRAEATTAVQTVAARLATGIERPSASDPGAEVVSLLADNDDPGFERSIALAAAVSGAVGLLVLLVTCTNTAALLTGLAMARQREIAIRLSLGAGRRRILRQLLTESTLLAGMAGGVTLAFVYVVWRLTIAFLPSFPFVIAPTEGVLFTVVVSLAVGVLFGLSPALHAARIGIATALKDSAAAVAGVRSRLQRRFVVAQIALTQPLMVGLVGLLLVTVAEYVDTRPTEIDDHVIQLVLRPSGSGAFSTLAEGADAARVREDLLRLMDRLRNTPGVVSAVPNLGIVEAASVEEATTLTQLGGHVPHPDDAVVGTPADAFDLSVRLAWPGYFALMSIPVTMGREFEASDPGLTSSSAVAEMPVLIGADLAARLWPGVSAIGRRLAPSAPGASTSVPPDLVVVGVFDEPGESRVPENPTVFVAGGPNLTFMTLLIRTAGLAASVMPTVRAIVVEEVPSLGIASIETMGAIRRADRRWFLAAVLAMGGGVGLALFLSAIGLYAVIAFSVRQRTSEIAVRVAVGARARQIVAALLGDGLRLAGMGSAIGLPASLLILWVYRSDPEMARATPQHVIGVTALAVLLVATAATWIPARRAAAIHPAVALRGN